MVRIGVSYITRDQSGNAYLEALRRAGAEPVVLATAITCPQWLTAEQAEEFFAPDAPGVAQLNQLDGLLLTGGGDVDPMLYREALAGSDPPNWPRDHLETAQFHRARQRGIPILGICRGLQFLNVVMGGSLVQHLPDWEAHGAVAPDYRSKAHPVRLDPESYLARVLTDGAPGEAIVAVNSRHHQAVTSARLAPGLLVSASLARAIDGSDAREIVEGCETPATRAGREFVLGVQWHPERVSDAIPPASGQPLSWEAMSERLFAAFVEAAGQAK